MDPFIANELGSCSIQTLEWSITQSDKPLPNGARPGHAYHFEHLIMASGIPDVTLTLFHYMW